MEVRLAADPAEVPPAGHRCYIESKCEFATMWQMSAVYATGATIVCQFYELEDSQRFIPVFRPGPVPILKLRYRKTALKIWPRRTRRGSGAPGAAGDAPEPDPAAEGDELDIEDERADGGADAVEEGEPAPLEALGDAADLLLAEMETAPVRLLEEKPISIAIPEAVVHPVAVGGSSASSSAAPVAVPPVPSPPARAEIEPQPRGKRGRPLAQCAVPGGIIGFYANGKFQATCRIEGHHACILTRQGFSAAGKGGDYRGGRPLGFMAAWLFHGIESHKPDKAEHWMPSAFLFTHDVRLEARKKLLLLPGGSDLAAHEKDAGVLGFEHEPEFTA